LDDVLLPQILIISAFSLVPFRSFYSVMAGLVPTIPASEE
jgi:hypothetical protein